MTSHLGNLLPDLCGHYVVDGRYHLTSLVGTGGFGRVYRATDTFELGREVAIKCISKEFKNWKDELELHKRAAAASPSVLPIYEAYEDEGLVYVVLELCSTDLWSYVHERGKLTEEWALWFFVNILNGVLECHSRGVYHRDLKADNILLAYNSGSQDTPSVYISDFGLATYQPLSNEFHFGTKGYMSPECSGDMPGSTLYSVALNDVWSLGVIFFYMLTGHAPWHSASPADPNYSAYLSDSRAYLSTHGIEGSFLELFLKIFDIGTYRISLPDLLDIVNDIYRATEADILAMEEEEERIKFLGGHSSPTSRLTSRWTSQDLVTPRVPATQPPYIGIHGLGPRSGYLVRHSRTTEHADRLAPFAFVDGGPNNGSGYRCLDRDQDRAYVGDSSSYSSSVEWSSVPTYASQNGEEHHESGLPSCLWLKLPSLKSLGIAHLTKD